MSIPDVHWPPEREVLAVEVERNVLAIREQLVRHDENMKAWVFISQCVPYWLEHRPAIKQAVADQQEMVAHALSDDAYDKYYGDNPNELGFEQAYGIQPKEALDAIPRVKWLAERLVDQVALSVIDLSANDGWMPQALREEPGLGNLVVDCMDLNSANVDRAEARKRKKGSGIGEVIHANILDYEPPKQKYDAVVLFETLEHFPEPLASLKYIKEHYVGKKGTLYVSTPMGAVENGNLPNWDKVERKGHLWAFTPQEFFGLLEQVGEVREKGLGADGVMLGEVQC